MSAHVKSEPNPMTIEAFLAWEGEGDTRHELVDGQIVAMSPPSRVHSRVTANLAARLENRLRPPYMVLVEAGIHPPERDDIYYQADLAIDCTPLTPEGREGTNPLVIVEILSPTTKSHDRGVKLADYRTIPSVQAILLVSSVACHVEYWRRDGAGWRVLDLIGRHTRLRLDPLELEVTLDEIYAGLDWLG
ncbi:MAG: Uma2 family endonuclease [Magnetococcales bacterium]|nr:Uma2 family endonuclease [Magnetococcales bacterium]